MRNIFAAPPPIVLCRSSVALRESIRPRPESSTMSTATDVDAFKLLLGRHHEAAPDGREFSRSASGRSAPPIRVPIDGQVVYACDATHVLTLSPSGSKRLRSCIIPNLLSYRGSLVTVDPAGEAYAATAQARREMGHLVVRLDPFGVVDNDSDALSPLALLDGLQDGSLEAACLDIAGLIVDRNWSDDVWERSALGLISGVIGYLSAVPEKGFADLYSVFHSDDVVYNLAVVLDTIGKKIPKTSYAEISSFLQRSDPERSRILTSVTTKLKAIGLMDVARTIGSTSFPMSAFIEGAPVSIYLIVPLARLGSHGALLRLWIGTLLLGAMGRRTAPAQPTLFVLNECAALQRFPLLGTAIGSGERCGVRVWTFWQDLLQLRFAYPDSWLVNECNTVQVFGVRDYSASAELAVVLGVAPDDLRGLAADEQIVCDDGGASRIRLLDYLTDPLFAEKLRANDSPQA